MVRRYSTSVKAMVIKWVQENPGKETVLKAVTKFKISRSSIYDWLKKNRKKAPVKIERSGSKKWKKSFSKTAKGRVDSLHKEIRAAEEKKRATNARLKEILERLGWPDTQ